METVLADEVTPRVSSKEQPEVPVLQPAEPDAMTAGLTALQLSEADAMTACTLPLLLLGELTVPDRSQLHAPDPGDQAVVASSRYGYDVLAGGRR